MKVSFDIGGRTLTLRSTVYTWFAYKAQFGHELAEDLKRAVELDGQREVAGEVESAALYGEECRLFLQVLWAFADAGTPGLPPFDAWLKTIKGVDMPSVVKVVTELYIDTMKPDKRYRMRTEDGDTTSLTTEELAEMIYSTGADSMALRDLTVGMALNLAHAHINSIRRAKGETVADPEKQYKQLRGILDAYERGEIPDSCIDKAELERVRKAVKEWEDG